MHMPITLTAMRSLSRPEGWPLHLALGAIIAVAYPWHPLYSGNQNVYLVHALAHTIMPGLQSDPIFLQPDPFPLFTWLSIALLKVHPVCMHLAYALLNGVYVHALFRIVLAVMPKALEGGRLLPFCTFFVLLHTNELWGTMLGTLTGIDLRWFFDSGMAEQGVLRGYWQPSVFGVFLLLGLSLWFEGRLVVAMSAVAVAGAFHANYLFLGGCMGITFLFISIIQRNYRQAAFSAIVAAVVVAPSTYLTIRDFVLIDPKNASDMADAARQLAIGHVHFDPHQWLNAKTIIQATLFLLFILLFRDDKNLRPIFLLAAVAGVASIVASQFPGSALHSLTPWRMTVVLFPLAFTLILARLCCRTSQFAPILLGFLFLLISIILFRVFGGAGQANRWQWAAFAILIFAAVSSVTSIIRKPQVMISLAIGCIVLSAISGLLSHVLEQRNLQVSTQFEVARAIRASGTHGTVMAPAHFTLLRLATGHPVLIDANLHLSPELGDRLRLLRSVEASYASDTFNLSVVNDHPEIKLLIIPKKKMPAGLTDWHLFATTSDHAILKR